MQQSARVGMAACGVVFCAASCSSDGLIDVRTFNGPPVTGTWMDCAGRIEGGCPPHHETWYSQSDGLATIRTGNPWHSYMVRIELVDDAAEATAYLMDTNDIDRAPDRPAEHGWVSIEEQTADTIKGRYEIYFGDSAARGSFFSAPWR